MARTNTNQQGSGGGFSAIGTPNTVPYYDAAGNPVSGRDILTFNEANRQLSGCDPYNSYNGNYFDFNDQGEYAYERFQTFYYEDHSGNWFSHYGATGITTIWDPNTGNPLQIWDATTLNVSIYDNGGNQLLATDAANRMVANYGGVILQPTQLPTDTSYSMGNSDAVVIARPVSGDISVTSPGAPILGEIHTVSNAEMTSNKQVVVDGGGYTFALPGNPTEIRLNNGDAVAYEAIAGNQWVVTSWVKGSNNKTPKVTPSNDTGPNPIYVGNSSADVTGTFIFDLDCTWANIKLQAAGGSGASAQSTGIGQVSAGSSAGAGGYIDVNVSMITGPFTPGVPITYVLGKAGAAVTGAAGQDANDSSFGTYLAAFGGKGGRIVLGGAPQKALGGLGGGTAISTGVGIDTVFEIPGSQGGDSEATAVAGIGIAGCTGNNVISTVEGPILGPGVITARGATGYGYGSTGNAIAVQSTSAIAGVAGGPAILKITQYYN